MIYLPLRMKLAPGFYKLRTRDTWGRKFTAFSYLRIRKEQQQRYMQLNHGLEEELDDEKEKLLLESFTIVKQIKKPISVTNATISVTFRDEDGDPFEMQVRHVEGLDRIFNSFPRVYKELGGADRER